MAAVPVVGDLLLLSACQVLAKEIEVRPVAVRLSAESSLVSAWSPTEGVLMAALRSLIPRLAAQTLAGFVGIVAPVLPALL